MTLNAGEEILSAHLQVIEGRARHVQQRGRDSLGDHLKRHGQRLVQTGERIGTGELEDLENEAEQIVLLEEGGQVEDASGQVREIDASKAVDGSGVASDAMEWLLIVSDAESKMTLTCPARDTW